MINILSMYSFMDLLKDYNYVPEAEHVETQTSHNITVLVDFVSNLVKVKTTDYDFMDLLANNGYVPTNDNWAKPYSNDNNEIVEIAS